MSFFTPTNLRAIAGGRWLKLAVAPASLSGLGIDTRRVLAGKAFLAIRGEQHDGHDFLDQAVSGGAGLLIVERDIETGRYPAHVSVMRVDTGLRTLTRLARAYRRMLMGTKVIGITGSAGKTTTKRMIDAVLSTRLTGTSAPRSFNNAVGVPLTILSARPGDKYLIVEIGTNAPGEIAHLSEIAWPDIAVITMIGRSHLQGFGSVEAVAEEKAALLHSLRDGAVVIAHADSPLLRPYLRRLPKRVLFGASPDADLRLTNRGGAGERWWLEINGRQRFGLGLPGRHNAVNALAAIAVGRRFGLSDDEVARALEQVRPEAMRMTRQMIGGVDVHNDAYNANPDSTIAALETFAELTPSAQRRIVLLGDMLELGDQGETLHREIGQRLRDLDGRAAIDRAILIGPLARFIADELALGWPESRFTHHRSVSALLRARGLDDLGAGDALLIKGSRGMALEAVIAALEKRSLHHANGGLSPT